MTPATKSLLVLSLAAALFACKKKESASTGSGTASGTAAPVVIDAAAAAPAIDAPPPAPAIDAAEAPAAAKRTPELEALDQIIAPILAISDNDARSKALCAALDNIRSQIIAVRKNPPAGVAPDAWTDVAERMYGGLEDVAISCAEDGYADTKLLPAAVETEKEFDALMAKKPD